MSPIVDLEAKCTEHVLSLKPTPAEGKALKELDVGLLAEDISWPLPLTNYLHRYMHCYNLYQVPKYRTVKLRDLVKLFGHRSALPGTEEVLEKLSRKCLYLIGRYSQAWKDEGMLVLGDGRGAALRKSPALRDAWNHHKDTFRLDELKCHWGLATQLEKTGSETRRSLKRSAESLTSGAAKRACTGPDQGHDHARASSETIFVDHPVRSPTAVTSPRPSSPCDSGQSTHEQLIDEARAAVALLLSLGSSQDAARKPTPPNALPTTEHVDDGTAAAAAAGNTVRSPTLVMEGPPAGAGPVVRTPTHPSSPSGLHQLGNAAAPIQHARDTAWPSGPGGAVRPSQPRAQEVYVEAHNPLQSGAPPGARQMSVITRSERRATPPNIQAERQGALYIPHPRHLPNGGLITSLEHAVTTRPPGAIHELQNEGQFTLQKLRQLGQLLLARRGVPGLWTVEVDVLMRQGTVGFFTYCCRYMGLPRIYKLGFKLPDWNAREIFFISRDNPQAFEDLKRIILDLLLALLRIQPGLKCFRIEVAAYPRSHPVKGGSSQPGVPTATATQPSMMVQQPMPSAPRAYHRGNRPPHSPTHIIVRTRKGDHGGFSCRYQGTILGQEVTNAFFFEWFAKGTGFRDPLGPFELEFFFKDALPPKTFVIARGNEAYFQNMKRDITLACEQTAALVPDLFEFAILVRAPGWAGGGRLPPEWVDLTRE